MTSYSAAKPGEGLTPTHAVKACGRAAGGNHRSRHPPRHRRAERTAGGNDDLLPGTQQPSAQPWIRVGEQSKIYVIPTGDAAHRLALGHDVLHEGHTLRRRQLGVRGDRRGAAALRNSDDRRHAGRRRETEILRIDFADGGDGGVGEAGDHVESGHARNDDGVVGGRRAGREIESVPCGSFAMRAAAINLGT